MHFPGADLHLKGDTGVADDGGMKGLVQVGLGGGDVVLEPAGNWVIHIMDQSQHIIAIGNIIHDDAEGAQVKDLPQRLLLGKHLAIDGINVLDAAGDGAVDALILHPVLDAHLGSYHELLVALLLLGQGILDLLIADGVKILEREIFQLPLDALHPQPVGDGGVDLQCLSGFLSLFSGGLVLHGAHIVQPVAELD